jgi:hypothetical protein
MVRSSNIDSYDLTVELDHGSDLGLILLPLVSLCLNLSLLLFQFLLHVQVKSFQKFMVGNQLIANSVVLECSIVEQVVDSGNVISEDLLDLLDS